MLYNISFLSHSIVFNIGLSKLTNILFDNSLFSLSLLMFLVNIVNLNILFLLIWANECERSLRSEWAIPSFPSVTSFLQCRRHCSLRSYTMPKALFPYTMPKALFPSLPFGRFVPSVRSSDPFVPFGPFGHFGIECFSLINKNIALLVFGLRSSMTNRRQSIALGFMVCD